MHARHIPKKHFLSLAVCTLVVLSSAALPAQAGLKLTENEKTIVVQQDGQTVLTYNKVSPPAPEGMDRVYERSGCLHPVGSPRGRVATAMFPVDHAHQNGIFTAWVKTTWNGRKIDFWNLAKRTGRVEHHKVVQKNDNADKASFTVELTHKTAEPVVDVLREKWTVTVYQTNNPWHCFDLETHQTALTDKPLKIHKYHYGGVAVRGPAAWVLPKKNESPVDQASTFLNDKRSNRLAGNHQPSRWVAMSGFRDGKPVTISVLCHIDNFRAPQTARLHPTKPYFCFAPCVTDEFQIDKDHPFHGRYRYLVTDAEPDPDWLDEQWKEWCGNDSKTK